MSRNKQNVEVLPSPAAMERFRSGVDKAELDRLVQEKVAQVMAERDAVVFEPFFRSRQIAYELKRLQTVPEQRKWSVCYQRFGCICCETTKAIHAGNGMCFTCHQRWFYRLTQIIAEGVNGRPALPAVGTPRQRAMLPTGQPEGVHHTWFKQRRRRPRPKEAL